MNRRDVLMKMFGMGGVSAVMPMFPAPATPSTEWEDEDINHLCPVCKEPYYFKEEVQLSSFDSSPRFYRKMTHAYVHTHGKENLCIEAIPAMPAQQYPRTTGIKYWSKHTFNPELNSLGRSWAEERNKSEGMVLDFKKRTKAYKEEQGGS